MVIASAFLVLFRLDTRKALLARFVCAFSFVLPHLHKSRIHPRRACGNIGRVITEPMEEAGALYRVALRCLVVGAGAGFAPLSGQRTFLKRRGAQLQPLTALPIDCVEGGAS